MSADPGQIPVLDPFGAAGDEALPTVAAALDPATVNALFKRGLPRLAGEDGFVEAKAIRVIRHKPGKRCVLEFDVRIERPGHPREKATLVGKIRARRYGREGYRLQDAFWNAGFRKRCPDNIAVPEPVGLVPDLRLWLQRKVRGVTADQLLPEPDGLDLAGRIAAAAHKIHRAGVPPEKTHSMADELRILHECVPRVGTRHPEFSARLQALLTACDRLGAVVPPPLPCGIHRDFYPSQVLVDGDRLWLLDFDLYCAGDPGLDIGNFIAHLTEESLRTTGHPDTWRDREAALENRFVALAGEAVRPAVHAYTLLTLVRHVYLSTLFPDRQRLTGQLLALCETRLAAAGFPT